tara:strand:+ start:1149 stop:1403 length:255 start_codon:yes stop_codon:yes gene_type:complete
MARYKNINGVRIQFTAEEETLRDAEEAQAAIEQTAYDAKKYQRDRELAYPKIGDQLDMQYHDKINGTTTWEDAIAKVKTDNPKE